MPPLFPSTLLKLSRGRVPGQVVIQYTDVCNASCPQCGMRRDAPFKRSTLGMGRAKDSHWRAPQEKLISFVTR
jgi:hypothetical protein